MLSESFNFEATPSTFLFEDIHEKKMRIAMGKAFEELRENAHVDNYLAGSFKLPQKAEDNLSSDVNVPEPKVRTARSPK